MKDIDDITAEEWQVMSKDKRLEFIRYWESQAVLFYTCLDCWFPVGDDHYCEVCNSKAA